MANSQSRIADTIAKIEQRIQVPVDTVEGNQIPAAGLAAIIWRKAMSRNTTECTRAIRARLRLVNMVNSSMLKK